MRRPAARITSVAVAFAVQACGGSAGVSTEPLPPTGMEEEALREELLAYVDRVMGHVVQMSDAALAADSAPDVRAMVQTLKADLASTSVGVAVGADAESALQDLMVSMSVRAAAFDAAAPESLAPSARTVVQEALDALAADIWGVGAVYYSADELTSLRGRVDRWAKETEVAMPRGVVRASDLPAGAGPALGKGLFAPLDAATRQLRETTFLGERALFLAERLPVVSLWQAEALTWKILAAPDARQALADFTTVSASMERLAAEVDSLPALMEGQREALLAAFDEREGTLRALLDQASSVMQDADALTESGTRVATLTNDAAASLDETLATAERLVTALRDADAPGGALSFEVESYTAALGDFKAATEALNAALERAEGMSETPRDIIDHAAWRAAQLLLLLFALMAMYRFGPGLLKRRRGESG